MALKEFWLNSDECTGCAACVNSCPVDAIDIIRDIEGFDQPRITSLCVDCGLCELVCRRRFADSGARSLVPEVYAGWSRDECERFTSTSGGAFSALSRVVLRQKGAIVGAGYLPDNSVAHMAVFDEEGLRNLRQSKYVQSSIGLVFREIKELLDSGPVLFCGAPCQVAGLRAYLGKEYDNLYLIDFICRGVNSPKAYLSWLTGLEEEAGASVRKVWFKYKDGGWKSSPRRVRIDFSDGGFVVQNGRDCLYMNGYLESNLYLRPCCGECQFKGFPRQGDITLADFWGLDESLDDDKGASMMLLNNEKGRRLFHDAAEGLEKYERDFESIFAGNVCLNTSARVNPKSKEFLRSLDTMSFREAVRKYSKAPFPGRLGRKIKTGLKRILGKRG